MASNQDKRIRIETILAEADKLLDQMKDNKNKNDDIAKEIATLTTQATENAKSISGIASQAKTHSESISRNKTEIDEFMEGIIEKEKKLDQFQTKIDEKHQKITEYQTGIESLKSDYEEIRQKIEDLLPGATGVGLSQAFYERKMTLRKTISTSTWCFYFSIFLLIGFGFWFFWKSSEASSLSEVLLTFLPKAPILLGILLLEEFSRRKHNNAQRLEEDYAFKEATSKSFDGYQKAMSKQKTTDETLAKILGVNVLGILGERPGRLLINDDDGDPIDLMQNGKALGVESNSDLITSFIPKPWLNLFSWCRHPVFAIMFAGSFLIFAGFLIGCYFKGF